MIEIVLYSFLSFYEVNLFSASSEVPSERNSVEILQRGNTFIPHSTIHGPLRAVNETPVNQ